MMDEQEIKQYVDVEDALARIRGNTKLFKLLLKTFLGNENFGELKQQLSAEDREGAGKSVHALKGVAANLSMKKLYESCVSFEALLKTGGDFAEAFVDYTSIYEKTIESVGALLPTLPA